VTGRDVPDRDVPDFPRPNRRDVPVLSDASLAALLAGAEPPGGPAPELRPLAEALAGLRAKPAGDELEGEAATLAAFQDQFGPPGPACRPSRRRPLLLSRPLPVKAAAAIAAVVLSLGGLATAAYAGALPAPVQRFAHDIIGAPSPGTRSATRPSSPGAPGPGHPADRLCAAWAHAKAHGTGEQRAVAFGKLVAAAGGADNVTAYCAAVARAGTSPSPSPQPVPAPHGSGKPSGLPAPHGSGKPSGLPAPHGSGKPSGLPAQHGSGKPSGLPAQHGSGDPTVHPSGKPPGQP